MQSEITQLIKDNMNQMYLTVFKGARPSSIFVNVSICDSLIEDKDDTRNKQTVSVFDWLDKNSSLFH